MARKKANIHYLYKTTCLITNKYYIGMHSTSNLEDGYMGSGKRLRYSIRKYGVNNHKKEILEFFETRDLLIEAEKVAITSEMITNKDCMNLMSGGTGGFYSIEAYKKGAKIMNEIVNKRKKEDPIFKEKCRLANSKVMKELHKLGKVPYGKSFKGKKHSEETKDLIGKKNKEFQTGEGNSQYGTCWITNGVENKKINKNNNLPNGWKLGRIVKNKHH